MGNWLRSCIYRAMPMRKKIILIFIFLIIGIIILKESNLFYKKSEKCINCNVILISIDTLRADHLGCYGYSRNTSPNIDKIAEDGVLFKNNFAQSFNTLPSHMSIFTSLYPSTHGVINVYEDKLDNSTKTITQILNLYGYHTAWFGVTDDPHLNLTIGFERGFDEIHSNYLWNYSDWREPYEWINKNSNKKFFIFLHTYRVHDPYTPPSPYDKLFDPDYQGKIVGEEEKFYSELEKYHSQLNPSDPEREFYWQFVNKTDEKDIKHIIALYDGQIAFADTFIKGLLIEMENSKISGNTIIIITADHGEEFGEHGNFLHEDLHDEVLHTPLIIRIPGVKNKIVDSQVQSIDIMPTVLDILGIPIPHEAQGKSLLPLILGKVKQSDEYTYGYWPGTISIRSDEWKLIINKKGFGPAEISTKPTFTGDVYELYDIQTDSIEKFDVAQVHPEVVSNLKDKINNWLNETQSKEIKIENKGPFIGYP